VWERLVWWQFVRWVHVDIKVFRSSLNWCGSIRLRIGNFVQRDLLQVLEPDAAAGQGRAVATGLNPDASVRQGTRRQRFNANCARYSALSKQTAI